MKKPLITVLIALSVLTAANRERNLPRMTEITLAEPVFVIGVDKGEDDNVIMSLIYERIENADEGAENTNQKFVKSAEGSSAAAALEVLKRGFSREIAVSTADYFLIGEDAARESLEKYTDYLSRNNNLKLTASVFIVRGSVTEATEIITETKTLDIMRNFGQNSGVNAFSSPMMFFEFLSELAVTGRAFAVPALIIGRDDSRFSDAAQPNVVPNGYAIIDNGVLKGFLDDSASRGYNIIKNKPVRSTVEIEKMNIAAGLETAKRNIHFNFDGDNLINITISVDITSSAVDRGVHGKEDLNDPDIIKKIEKEQARVIFSEIRKTIAASKIYECDFLGIGDILRMKHPYRWHRMKSDWDEIYARTPVRIEVNSRLMKH